VRRWAAYCGCLAVLGYIDLVALSVVIGHAAGAALRWRQDRDTRLLGFAAAMAAGLAACAPLAALSLARAGSQVWWVNRPGLNVYAFYFLTQNLFYSTAVAAAVIVLAVLAWAAWRPAAFATAMAVLPAGALWLLSQGPHSYFISRYLLFTIGAWSILAGIALSRLDVRLAAAAVLVIGMSGAVDQQVIREPGAHSWSTYPVIFGGYLDYAGAAHTIARDARAGDGIVYREGTSWWLMIGPGLQYYLQRDMPHGVPVPRELFVAATAPQSSQINPAGCHHPAACLGDESRIWIVGSGRLKDPYRAVEASQAAVLRPRYRLGLTRHFPGLTVFLLVRDTWRGSPA
jgi:mannosyltransferase